MELLNQDTFYWGTLKGVGKVYVQVVVDTFCSLAFAKVYTSKMPVTAADTLYERVLPFYEALDVPVQAILTDNGREFCGKPDSHPYELLLAMEGIEHRTTKIATPRTNGFVERMNRTLLDECFRVAGHQTSYIPPPRSSPTSTPSCATTTSNAAIRATASRAARRLKPCARRSSARPCHRSFQSPSTQPKTKLRNSSPDRRYRRPSVG